MPDNERERRMEELHSGALKLRAGERDEFLRQGCAGDTELRQAVEALLGAPQRQTTTVVAGIDREQSQAGQTLGRIICCSPSARAAWARYGWRNRGSRCAAALPSS